MHVKHNKWFIVVISAISITNPIIFDLSIKIN